MKKPRFWYEGDTFLKIEKEKDSIKNWGGGWTINEKHCDFNKCKWIVYRTEKKEYRISVESVIKNTQWRKFGMHGGVQELKRFVSFDFWDWKGKNDPFKSKFPSPEKKDPPKEKDLFDL